jgi:hypothetical protein
MGKRQKGSLDSERRMAAHWCLTTGKSVSCLHEDSGYLRLHARSRVCARSEVE